MRIQHVITTLDMGGAEVHLLSQVRGQVARGHEVRVAWLKGEGSLAEDFREAGASEVLGVGVSIGGVRRLMGRARAADILHSHLLKADALTAIAATLAGARGHLVSGKHNDERALLNPLVSLVHGVLGNLPVMTIALSDHVRRFVEEHGRVRPDRMERVYYGIDATRWEDAARSPERSAVRAEFGWPDDALVLICVARFAEQKAHEILLRAFDAARRDERVGDRLRLLLVGDDPFGEGRRRAEDEASRLDLGNRVAFAGIRRDVPRLLAASDVFTMASRWEGLGLVFLESLAAKVPVASTHVSAIPEVVQQGETGLLVPPDDPGRLAAALLELALDDGLRRRMGECGQSIVRERFSLDRMVDETLALYERVLARG